MKEEKYWLNQFSGNISKSCFPFDYKNGKSPKREMEEVDFTIPGHICGKLNQISNHSDVKLFMILNAGIITLLRIYTGKSKIVLGTTIFKQEIEADFLNKILAIRYPVSEEITFKELLMKVRQTILAAVEHQNYPIEKLIQNLNIEYLKDGDFPLFDVSLILENIHYKNYIQEISHNVLFILRHQEDTLTGVLKYNRQRYDQKTVRQIISHFIQLLREVTFNIDTSISLLDIMGQEEKRNILFEINAVETDFPQTRTLTHLFEENAKKSPYNVALVFDEFKLTYGELNIQANQMAYRLTIEGVSRGDIVGILLLSSPDMMAAILGILKAGGTYLPIDASYPTQRITMLLKDCCVSILITNTKIIENHSFSVLQGLQLAGIEPEVTSPRPQITEFSKMPFANRSLVDYKKYHQFIGQGMVTNSMTLQATRGCPYNCAYCCRVWPRKYIFRSAENLIEEILIYYNMGIKRFVFIDDIFNLNEENSKRFFKLIIQKGLKLHLLFPSGLRGDILTREYIDLMVEAGVIAFPLALETASPRLQKMIGKNIDLDRLSDNISYILEKYPQVILELHTIHGFPSETEAEALMTLDFIKKFKGIHFPYIHILKIFPGTTMEELALENGISQDSILRSAHLSYHELPETLPFAKEFTLKYQADFLNTYFLDKQRLIDVLPNQMKVLTQNELIQKYNSYLPTPIKSFDELLEFLKIDQQELPGVGFLSEEGIKVPFINEKISRCFPAQNSGKNALRILLIDVSQEFTSNNHLLYDVVEQPLGLMYLMSYLTRELGNRINGKITKSRIDFDSYEELKSIITEFRPDIIGIRALSFYKGFFHKIVANIRSWGITVPLIAGGPYATIEFRTLLQDENVDLAVLGEGEVTLCHLVEKILENRRKLPDEPILKQIPGIAFIQQSDKMKRKKGRKIFLMDQWQNRKSNQLKGELSIDDIRPTDFAYMIYTSGSTGNPKAVSVNHYNVSRVVKNSNYIAIKSSDQLLQLSNYAFDGSIFDIFGAFLNGARLVMCKTEKKLDPDYLAGLIKKEKISVFFLTTALFNVLVDTRLECFANTRKILFGGERVSVRHVKKALDYLGKDRIIHVYGPTETTVFATYYRVNEIDERKGMVPIGRPISNTKVFILNTKDQPVPIGVMGELYIGGDGTASGYLNNPELTSERFCLRPPETFLKKGFWTSKNFLLKQKLLWGVQGGDPAAQGAYNVDPDMLKKVIYMKKRSFVIGRPCHGQKRPPIRVHAPRARRRHRLYRTGDLCRWLSEGNIEFLGRMDHQVKLRGFRIEMGEIESCLLKHDEISQAYVMVLEEEQNNKYLCAYLVSHIALDSIELRDYLAKDLPDYMIPVYFVTIDELPLTSNGKVDGSRLPHPQKIKNDKVAGCEAPNGPIEKILADVWKSVLGLEKISVNEDFFMIGGDSITVIRIISQLKELGYMIEMKDIFTFPTIRELAPVLKKISLQELEYDHQRENPTGEIPLTPIQKMFFQKIKTDPHHFNQAVMFYNKEGFDDGIIKKIFKKIQWHHDALRISFKRNHAGEIQQVNHGPDYPLYLKVYDFRNTNNVLERLKEVCNTLQGQIDLENGPLMKLGLFHMDDGSRLLVIIHHLVVDGVSWRILFEDFDRLYRQAKKSEPFVLPQKTDSFQKWAKELSIYARSETLLKEENYWARIESLEFPKMKQDFDMGSHRVKDGRTISMAIDKDKTNDLLTGVNKAFGTEINEILLTALGLAFRESQGFKRVLVALEGHGRESIIKGININRTVGWFTTTFPVFLNMKYGDNLSRQIIEVKEYLRRIPHRGIGYGILKYLTPPNLKSKSYQNNPSISFNYLGQFDSEVKQLSFKIARESTGNLFSPHGEKIYPLDFVGIISNERLSISLTYNSLQFKKETIQRLLESYRQKLNEIIDYCMTRKTSEITPYDLTYKELSIETLERFKKRFDIEDIYTLTPMQEGIFFHTLYEPSGTAYFAQISYRLKGIINPELGEKTLEKLIHRHEILRTSFIQDTSGLLLQIVLKKRDIDFVFLDASDEKNPEEYINQIKIKDRACLFDLSNDVLIRLKIVKITSSHFELIWSMHHILMDGWCLGILFSEYFEIYMSLQENREIRLNDVQPYRTYIQWLEKQDKSESMKYWANYLKNYHQLAEIPGIKNMKINSQPYNNEEVSFKLKQEMQLGLEEIVGSSRITMNTIIQVIWGILLSRYNEKTDVVFGTVVSGRPHDIKGVESMMGLFINTIPVRICYQEDTTFIQLLREIQEEAILKENHHHYPLADIQANSQLRQKLFDHLLLFQNYKKAGSFKQIDSKDDIEELTDKNDFQSVGAFDQTHYDFNIHVCPGIPLKIYFKYNGNVYDKSFIEKIPGHFCQVLEQILRNNAIKIIELKILSKNEEEQVLSKFNEPKNKEAYDF